MSSASPMDALFSVVPSLVIELCGLLMMSTSSASASFISASILMFFTDSLSASLLLLSIGGVETFERRFLSVTSGVFSALFCDRVVPRVERLRSGSESLSDFVDSLSSSFKAAAAPLLRFFSFLLPSNLGDDLDLRCSSYGDKYLD